MNKEWSELNKSIQVKLKKESTYKEGIKILFELRRQLMNVLISFKNELSREDFNLMPFINADGYHSKTIAYSLWHIFRIEDIVANSLINESEQIFFLKNYHKRIGSSIITTGNELVGHQIADFSKELNLKELYLYITDVKESTEEIIRNLSFKDLKRSITNDKKEYLKSLNVVSTDESAIWLLDYWSGKDIKGLIQMPFSRHWIMHIEASLRIKNKLYSE
ncbi:MAG: phage head-tail adapter protein [Clostridium sp.]|nr:phage head-tail adapter protein [Clostridium sp.]MBS5885437.1 phage head-tail adapter protein [Clostridium sp.]MDU7240675.1 phage head-tail adapter protein [Clostridium sp.]